MSTLTLSQWLADAQKQLTPMTMDPEMAYQDASWIAMHALKLTRTQMVTDNQRTIGFFEKLKLKKLLQRRLHDEPLAYILNSAPFHGRNFYVDQRVLIPRQETEDLLEIALRKIDNTQPVNIIDVGTGSGALAISVALERPKANIYATDISKKAIEVAKQNANQMGTKINFFIGRLLHPELMKHIGYNLPIYIIANLPYLPYFDKATMPKSVTKYEPSEALFADEEGLCLNSGLLAQAASVCPKLVLIEFDPPQAKELRDFATALFPNAVIRIHQDRCGRDRILEIAN